MSRFETHQELIAAMMARQAAQPVIQTKDIDGVIRYMKSDKCKKIMVMAGAGISTSAGIPDFRTPGTGLYDNLAKLNLPYPQAVFELGYFRQNPQAFYTLAKELAPGRFRPTITHAFVKLLADKDLLEVCYTQNIDTLERRAGVPPDAIIEAHGSFATQRCIECKRSFPDAAMAAHLRDGSIPRCQLDRLPPADDAKEHTAAESSETETDVCNGLVKPDIVFFGEPLPKAFFDGFPHTLEADLLLIMGTSLKVHPFADLADMGVCPRVLINRDPAGGIGSNDDDVVLLMSCDDAVREIARGMGWEDELDAAWAKTALATSGAPTGETTVQQELERIVENVGSVIGKKELAQTEVVDDLAGSFAMLAVDQEERAAASASTDAPALAQESLP